MRQSQKGQVSPAIAAGGVLFSFQTSERLFIGAESGPLQAMLARRVRGGQTVLL